MPTYTYRCVSCGEEWDERRDRNDPDLDIATDGCLYDGDFVGRRLPFWAAGAPAVYFHGRGWSRVDKNYKADE
jgi:predicted nucleic acid-binding Zn ribbon protein